MEEHDETRDRAKRILAALAKAKDASNNTSNAITKLNTACFDAGALAEREGVSDMADQLHALAGLTNHLASNIGELDLALTKIWDMPAFRDLEREAEWGSPPS